MTKQASTDRVSRCEIDSVDETLSNSYIYIYEYAL
jgi:hypothetical protein